MLLNNTTFHAATFAISTGSGRSRDFNVNSKTISDINVKNFQGPFDVLVRLDKIDVLVSHLHTSL